MGFKSTDAAPSIGLEMKKTGYASLVTTEGLSQQNLEQLTIWTQEPIESGQLYRLKVRSPTFNWLSWFTHYCGASPTITAQGRMTADYRAAWIRNERLVALLAVSPSAPYPDLGQIKNLCNQTIDLHHRRRLLSLKLPVKIEKGMLICHCFQIKDSQIKTAIESGDNALAALQKSLRCGTSCGSCINSIKEILASKP